MAIDEPVRQQLGAGEQLLWTGQPRQGLRATFYQHRGMLIVIPFLLGWLMLVVFLTLRHVRDVEGHLDLEAIIVGLFMLSFGGAMLIFTSGFDAVDRKHTFYGLTDQRVMLVTGIRTPFIRSFPLHQLQRFDVQMRDDGSGSVTFKDASYTRWDTSVVLSFNGIENVETVLELIRRANE